MGSMCSKNHSQAAHFKIGKGKKQEEAKTGGKGDEFQQQQFLTASFPL